MNINNPANLYEKKDGSGRTFKTYYKGFDKVPLWAGYQDRVAGIPSVKGVARYPYLNLKDSRIGTLKKEVKEAYHKRDGEYQGSKSEYVRGSIGVGFRNEQDLKITEGYRNIGRVSEYVGQSVPQYRQGNFQGNKLKKWTYFAGANRQQAPPDSVYQTLENKGSAIRMLASDQESLEGKHIRSMLQKKKEGYTRPSSYAKLDGKIQSMKAQGMYKGKFTQPQPFGRMFT